jgi:transposase-like protein
VIAIGANDEGKRKMLGFGLGTSEKEAFWEEFLLSFIQRGLQGMLLVTSDAREGSKVAIAQVLTGASWQRCWVHFMHNVLAHVPPGDQAIVAAALRTIYAQPSHEATKRQIYVRRGVFHPAGGGFVFQPPKTKLGKRTVQLGQGITDHLRAQLHLVDFMQKLARDKW